MPSELLLPWNTWEDKAKYDETKEKLIGLFQKNFEQFEAGVNREIVEAGPMAASMV